MTDIAELSSSVKDSSPKAGAKEAIADGYDDMVYITRYLRTQDYLRAFDDGAKLSWRDSAPKSPVSEAAIRVLRLFTRLSGWQRSFDNLEEDVELRIKDATNDGI
jgi:hypothetical protein